MTRFRYVRALAGAIFILAGVFAYYGVSFGPGFPLVLVVAGVVIIIVSIAGHRAGPSDIALFVIALIVLGGVGYGIPGQSGSSVISFSSLRNQATANIAQIDLIARTNSSSINIRFEDNSSLIYQVTFTREFYSGLPPFSFPFLGPDTYGVTNQTLHGILFLDVRASYRSVSIILPSSYAADINASTGAGSIALSTPHVENIGSVSLSTGAGSILANISSDAVRSLSLNTGAGSVTLHSNFLAPGESAVPISISTGTGSASMDVSIPYNSSAFLEATTGLGSISHNLSPDFAISQSSNSRLVASEGNTSNSLSFRISISTGTGSVSIKARTV